MIRIVHLPLPFVVSYWLPSVVTSQFCEPMIEPDTASVGGRGRDTYSLLPPLKVLNFYRKNTGCFEMAIDHSVY
jgi:hypothetical protein